MFLDAMNVYSVFVFILLDFVFVFCILFAHRRHDALDWDPGKGRDVRVLDSSKLRVQRVQGAVGYGQKNSKVLDSKLKLFEII